MKVLFPARIVDRHVGGNTTYGRRLEAGLLARGVNTGRIPAQRHPALTAFGETATALRKRSSQEVLHYLADTGPLLPARSPSVVTVHGIASRWAQGIRDSKQETIWRARVRLAIRNTTALVTVSQSSADDISEVFGVERDDITVIPHGLDLPTRSFDESALRDRFPDWSGNPYALYVGNIEPRKNLVELVRAFESPEVKNLGIPLVIAGKPAWNSERSMEAIRSASNVQYLGFVSEEEKEALLQNATMFIFPSLYEGFGFPVLEALARGVPTICSANGALAEIAGPAHILRETTSDCIADAVVTVFGDTNYRSEIRHLGPQWADRFKWDSSVDQHLAVYRKVL